MPRFDSLLPSPRSPLRWFGVLGVVALTAGALYANERLLGFRTPVCALNFHFLLMTGAVFVDKLLTPRLQAPRFEVSPWELPIYRRLGVLGFMRLLRRVGWHAAIRDRTVFDGTRRTLASYENATRHGENAHTWLFLIALVPTGWALTQGWFDAAFWIGSMNIAFHAYPVMLQRTQRARLTAILERIASRKPADRGNRDGMELDIFP